MRRIAKSAVIASAKSDFVWRRVWSSVDVMLDTARHARLDPLVRDGRAAEARLRKAAAAKGGLKILRGPFAGMPYEIDAASGSRLGPKVLGTYEDELSGHFETLIARRPDDVIVIGCAEGYYAVGMAVRAPAAHVTAFDIEPAALGRCAVLSDQNGVADRMTLRAACSPEALASLKRRGHRLILCDCEGYESVLFSAETASEFRDDDLLIETHDHRVPGVDAALRGMFAATHEIIEVDERPLDAKLVDAGHDLTLHIDAADLPLLVDERREGIGRWLVCHARSATRSKSDEPPNPSSQA